MAHDIRDHTPIREGGDSPQESMPKSQRLSPVGRSAMQGDIETFHPSSREINQQLYRSYSPERATARVAAGDKYPGVFIHPEGEVIGPYRQVRDFYRDANLTGSGGDKTMEAHHLLPKDVAEKHGLDPNQVPSVGLYWDEHRGPAGHPFGTKPRSDDLLVAAGDALDDYDAQGYETWSAALKAYLKENEAHIRSRYGPEDAERLDEFFRRVSS